jgi:hypothetical protein
MASFGDGLGGLIGSSLASSDLSDASMTIRGMGGDFNSTTEPYNQFGQSFLPQAQNTIDKASSVAASTPSFGDFMSGFSLSPGAQYTLGQAQEAQNNSAASTGQLLSGANERALTGITNGIVSNDIAQQYGLTLAGNNQQFGQLQSLIGDMFQGIGVGTTATGQQAGVLGAQMGAQSQIAQAQAKADQGKGSGIGGLFSGIGSLATWF